MGVWDGKGYSHTGRDILTRCRLVRMQWTRIRSGRPNILIHSSSDFKGQGLDEQCTETYW